MAREYLNINKDNEVVVKEALNALIDKKTTIEDYRKAFYLLGLHLGRLLRQKYNLSDSNCHLICASEDADWLASGVLFGAKITNADISVYWTSRELINKSPKIEVSSIYKEFNSSLKQCDNLIVVKSIISSSCVVKTQITHIINEVKPKTIHILSPVMLKSADSSLKKEFPSRIYDLFHFLTFAKDTDSEENGIVRPGIGGMVYPLLGINKESFFPSLVMNRMK